MGARTVLALIVTHVGGLLGGLAVPPPSLGAQETSRLPSAFKTLEGAWEGSGVLLDRPAVFRMRWEVLGGGFMHLTFSNSLVNEAGERVPVLSSHAVYYVQGGSASGVWLDDRPQRISLEASVTDSSVVTLWTADAEEGRTEYLIQSPNAVVVRDFVYVNGSGRLFAEATYRRGTANPRE